MVPLLDIAANEVSQADVLMIVGTSMQVYPAAGLINYVPEGTPIYFIDPNPTVSGNLNIQVFAEKAGIGVPKVAEILRKNYFKKSL